METSRRQKRVSSLIKEELSRLLIEESQKASACLITITRVEMGKDLKTALVHVSVFGSENKEEVLSLLQRRAGHFRKSIASVVKLKYNPMLIFSLDTTAEFQERLDRLIGKTKKNEP